MQRRPCEACRQPVPWQPYAGRPRRFCCDGCKKWAARHPGEVRPRPGCFLAPDDRTPEQVRADQRRYRSRVMVASYRAQRRAWMRERGILPT